MHASLPRRVNRIISSERVACPYVRCCSDRYQFFLTPAFAAKGHFRTHAVQQNQHFAQRRKPVYSIHAPLVGALCVAIGAPLESMAHLMIADPTADAFRTVANITGDLVLGALFDRLRLLAENGDGFTIVPRAEAFGCAIHDLAQPFPGTATIIEPSQS
jgi:hypothetical protein